MTKAEELARLRAWIARERVEWERIHEDVYRRFVCGLPPSPAAKTLGARAERLSHAHAALGELAL